MDNRRYIAPVDAALTPWRQVAAAADDFFAAVASRHGDRMRCGPGCTDCCHPDLALTYCESLALLLGLSQLSAAELAPLLRTARDPARAHCPLLAPDGRCAAYAMRPLICRTHGLPVLQDDELVLCPHNFGSGTPPRDAVLDGTLLAAQLAVADGIIRGEYLPPVRISIARIVLEGAAALPTANR